MKVTYRFLITGMFVLLVFCTYPILAVIIPDNSVNTTINSNTNNFFVSCNSTNPQTTLAFGAVNNANFHSLTEYLFCSKVTSDISTPVIYPPDHVADSANYGGSFWCGNLSNNHMAACGLVSSSDSNSANGFLDMLQCCNISDGFVDYNFSHMLTLDFFGSTSQKTLYCNKGYVVCGAKNVAGNNMHVDTIYCCPISGEDSASCAEGIDKDNDGLAGCADPDCNGLVGPGGKICQSSGETLCSDGVDNDGNGLTDMNDPSCLTWANTTLNPPADTSKNIIFNASPILYGYNPSALNGSDGVCGDDIGICSPPSCTSLNQLQCTGACFWSSSGTIDTFSTMPTGNSDCPVSAQDCAAINPLFSEVSEQSVTTSCCDDEAQNGCVHNNPNYSYVIQRTCTNPTSGVCVMSPAVCASQGSQDACTSAGCIWKSYTGYTFDYGYIDPTKQYMCYNYVADQNASNRIIPNDSWRWLFAPQSGVPYRIYTLNNSFSDTSLSNGTTTDVISNGAQWYYCNATGKGVSGLQGNAIPEYGSFVNQEPLTSMNCSIFISDITSTTFNECDHSLYPLNTPCCDKGVLNLTKITAANPCSCYANGLTSPFQFGSNLSTLCASGSPFNTYTYPKIKAYCDSLNNPDTGTSGVSTSPHCSNYQLGNCMEPPAYDSSESCAYNGGTNGGSACDPNVNYCTGSLVSTSDTPYCCIGQSAQCIPQSTGVTTDECKSYGGTVFQKGTQTCTISISLTDSKNNMCCLGIISTPSYDSLLGLVSNSSYICFNQGKNNYLGECCYGPDCNAIGLLPPGNTISYTGERLFDNGAPLHSVQNFDVYDPSKQTFIDLMDNITIVDSSVSVAMSNVMSLSGFAYVEFDIAFNNVNNIPNVSINDVNYGPVSQYISGYPSTMKWHRAIIPINTSQSDEKFTYLYFTSAGKVQVFLDNIFLATLSGGSFTNSENYYCTGGFGSWIPSLSPNLTEYPMNDTSFYGDWLNGYGKYALTCGNSIGPFGWTGHQCCGFNTNINNYGQFYNDSDFGCFNGTVIPDGSSIASSININERSKKFDEYAYKGLLYYDGTFIGCQVPGGTYNIRYSYDGTLNSYPQTNQGNLLLSTNNYVNTQCAVISNYFCENGAWKEYIVLNDTPQGAIPFNDALFTGQNLSMKMSPAGSNLIVSGFRGS